MSPFILSGAGGFDSNPSVRQITCFAPEAVRPCTTTARTDGLEGVSTTHQTGYLPGYMVIQRGLMIQFVCFNHCLNCALGMGFAI
jgi:hypothetical protein